MAGALSFSAALSSRRIDTQALNNSNPFPTRKGLFHVFQKYVSGTEGAGAFLELAAYATKWPEFFLRQFTPARLMNASDTLMDGKNVLSGVAIPESTKSFMKALDGAARNGTVTNIADAIEAGATLGNNVCDVGSLLESRKIASLPFGAFEKANSVFTSLGGGIGTAKAIKFLSRYNVLTPNSTQDAQMVRWGSLKLFEKVSYLSLGLLGLSNWILRTTYSSWTMTAAATSGVVFKILGDFYPKL